MELWQFFGPDSGEFHRMTYEEARVVFEGAEAEYQIARNAVAYLFQ